MAKRPYYYVPPTEETPDFKEVKAFLNAGKYKKAEVQDSEYLDDVLMNMGDYFAFEPNKKWKKEMIKAYQEYYFKKHSK